MHECNCIYCREIEVAADEQRRNARLARLEKEAMERLLNPPEVDEEDYTQYGDYENDDCDICGEDLVSSSHYHCYQCGKRCSMMGHADPITDKYTCDPLDVWEWNLVKDIYGS